MSNHPSAAGRWKAGTRAAVSLTFDNLGEAIELERGTWPPDTPLGQHPSVTHALPAILHILRDYDVAATFFIEGINADMYPQALAAIVAAGHEIGYHGWRHEEWGQLDARAEEQILERGLRAMQTLGIRPSGFRPPRGKLAASSMLNLQKLDFVYCSPAGPAVAVADGLVTLPFQWMLVDAYAYLPRFASMRESLSDSYAPLEPAHFQERLHAALQEAVQRQSYLSLLFHPFIAAKDEYCAVMHATLQELYGLVRDGSVWCAPCRDVARWVRDHPASAEKGSA